MEAAQETSEPTPRDLQPDRKIPFHNRLRPLACILGRQAARDVITGTDVADLPIVSEKSAP